MPDEASKPETLESLELESLKLQNQNLQIQASFLASQQGVVLLANNLRIQEIEAKRKVLAVSPPPPPPSPEPASS